MHRKTGSRGRSVHGGLISKCGTFTVLQPGSALPRLDWPRKGPYGIILRPYEIMRSPRPYHRIGSLFPALKPSCVRPCVRGKVDSANEGYDLCSMSPVLRWDRTWGIACVCIIESNFLEIHHTLGSSPYIKGRTLGGFDFILSHASTDARIRKMRHFGAKRFTVGVSP